jgi:hypothetical protein
MYCFSVEMNQKSAEDLSFGEWLRQRRHILDLTRQELADQVGCAPLEVETVYLNHIKSN